MSRETARPQHGFTIVELITVMVVIGILSAVALPMMTGNSMAGPAFRNELASTLRYAQKTAVSHRRLVCATVSAGSVTLNIASANGALACDTTLSSPDGNTVASRDSAVTASGDLVGTLFFQPNGTVTKDGAGTEITAGAIAITGQTSIALQGATGYVE